MRNHRETAHAVIAGSTEPRDERPRRGRGRLAPAGLVLFALSAPVLAGPVHGAAAAAVPARKTTPAMDETMPTTDERSPKSADRPAPAVARDAGPEKQPDTPSRPAVARRRRLVGELFWHVDYTAAYRQAQKRQSQLLIVFRSAEESDAADRYERTVLAASELKSSLADFVRVVLPCDARVPGDPSRRLLDARAFRHLNGRPGLAVIDLMNPDDHLYGRVVSAHPFSRNDHDSLRETKTVLNLPRGTLTQRALVYAVRTHPERPESADGQSSRVLFRGAASHSRTMVRYGQVGHFGWGRRSRRLESRLGDGFSVQEVAAVSWRTESPVEAARDCVEAWRSSPGHWSTVAGASARYGYDMRQAADGRWYATGLVATRRGRR